MDGGRHLSAAPTILECRGCPMSFPIVPYDATYERSKDGQFRSCEEKGESGGEAHLALWDQANCPVDTVVKVLTERLSFPSFVVVVLGFL